MERAGYCKSTNTHDFFEHRAAIEGAIMNLRASILGDCTGVSENASGGEAHCTGAGGCASEVLHTEVKSEEEGLLAGTLGVPVTHIGMCLSANVGDAVLGRL